LLDTLVDIADALNAALTKLGFPTHPTNSYRYFTGGGMDGLVRRILPENRRDEQTLSKCLTAAKEEYHKRWANHTRPYPGIPELLDALEKLKIPKIVLSNKPDEFTQIMVKKLLSCWSFRIVRGANSSSPKKPDPAVALEIADELQIPPEKFLYLGDTNTDMLTANAAGMYAAGVLWGFRSDEELASNGAKILVKTPSEVLTILDVD